MIRVWNTEGQQIGGYFLEGYVGNFAESSDGRFVVAAAAAPRWSEADEKVIWDRRSSEILWSSEDDRAGGKTALADEEAEYTAPVYVSVHREALTVCTNILDEETILGTLPLERQRRSLWKYNARTGLFA